MKEPILAVIDTNVLVASLLTKNRDSATVQILECIANGNIRPVYDEEIVSEYREVLLRKKFNFSKVLIDRLIEGLMDLGLSTDKTEFLGDMPDPKDKVFYEVSLTDGSYLVTGNIRHFPKTPKVVTPKEMLVIVDIHFQDSDKR